MEQKTIPENPIKDVNYSDYRCLLTYISYKD